MFLQERKWVLRMFIHLYADDVTQFQLTHYLQVLSGCQ